VQSLVDGDADTAFQQLCADGMNEVSSPADLQANFEGYLGGKIQSGSVTDAVGAQGDDYVTISATLDTGADKDFTVVVVQEGGGPAVCGVVDPSDIP
jgi:hypothetical protein